MYMYMYTYMHIRGAEVLRPGPGIYMYTHTHTHTHILFCCSPIFKITFFNLFFNLMILSGFSPVKANWWITFGMGADTKKQNNKKSQGGLTFLGWGLTKILKRQCPIIQYI
jgi:hypothetical protein